MFDTLHTEFKVFLKTTVLCAYPSRPPLLLTQSENAVLVSNARAALISACESLEARRLLSHSMDETQQFQMLYQGPVPPSPPDFRYDVSESLTHTCTDEVVRLKEEQTNDFLDNCFTLLIMS
jgi:hypothetical protein